ncbi:4Fe-4S ferredoxin [Desulfuromonas versatilis]|uniref:4Fe-4S ferredoxin n=1 Tax=Desulfuromonas versatilis TaxID=2802975 RepID=A0ABM8HSB0_9BACT|nr:4Fe-4S binding protein [Desulfuromonas versatilis]BCR04783.1 4Fe-4S ferredoxin [Desulfuromonas versatilis]
MIREIVKIDEEKCNGCGLCVPSCAEGAIKIVNGKAKLIADNLCDGLGACLGDCPEGAITIERREAEEFDEVAVEEHLNKEGKPAPAGHGPAAHAPAHGGGCPSARVMNIDRQPAPAAAEEAGTRQSQLRQWPVQMHLVPPTAPFLRDADLLLAADCAPFAYADFHKDFLAGKALLIGCPKLDDGQAYLEKLTAMLRGNNIKRLTVVHMEVPCCSGLIAIARQAIAACGKDVPLETIRIGIQGDVK